MSKEPAGDSAKAAAPAPQKKEAEVVANPEDLRMLAANMATHENKGHAGAALFAFGGVIVLAGALWAVIASATGGAAMSLGPLIMLGAGGLVMSVTGLTRMREGEVAAQLRAALVMSAERAERAAERAAARKAERAKPSERTRLTDKARPEPKAKTKSKKEDEEEHFERGVVHAALTEDEMLIKSYHLRSLHKPLLERISEAEAALAPDEHVAFVLVAETLKMQSQVLLLTSTRFAIINDHRVEWSGLADVKNALARWKSNSPQCELSLTIEGRALEWANVEPEATAFQAAKALNAGTLPLPARHISAHPSPVMARANGRYTRGTLASPGTGAMVAELAEVEVVLTANHVIHLVFSGEDVLALPASDPGVLVETADTVSRELQTGELMGSTAAKTLIGPMGLRGMPRDEPEETKDRLVLLMNIEDSCALVLVPDQGVAQRLREATHLPAPAAETPAEATAAAPLATPEPGATEDVGAMAAAIMAAVAADNSLVAGTVDPSGSAPAPKGPAEQAGGSGAVTSLVEELERVQKLHADGVLTDEELRSLTRRLVADDGAA